MGYVPFTARPHCGANVALVGKAHRCVAVPAVNTPPAVNKPEVSKPAVNMKRTHARLHGEEAGLGQPVTACRDSYGPRRCVAHSPCQKQGDAPSPPSASSAPPPKSNPAKGVAAMPSGR